MITLKQIQKHSLKISLSILALIAILIAWLALRPKPITISQTSPSDKSATVPLNSTVIITLDQPLNANDSLIINTKPTIAGKTTYISGRTKVSFQPQNFFQPDTEYTFTITGKTIADYTFTFHTRMKIPLSAKPTTADINPSTPYQKLLKTLPYNGENFQISHHRLDDSINISIWRKPIESTKQKALQYIKSFQISNPEKDLTIHYNIPRTIQP